MILETVSRDSNGVKFNSIKGRQSISKLNNARRFFINKVKASQGRNTKRLSMSTEHPFKIAANNGSITTVIDDTENESDCEIVENDCDIVVLDDDDDDILNKNIIEEGEIVDTTQTEIVKIESNLCQKIVSENQSHAEKHENIGNEKKSSPEAIAHPSLSFYYEDITPSEWNTSAIPLYDTTISENTLNNTTIRNNSMDATIVNLLSDCTQDESVVFVSEEIPSIRDNQPFFQAAPAYIPLMTSESQARYSKPIKRQPSQTAADRNARPPFKKFRDTRENTIFPLQIHDSRPTLEILTAEERMETERYNSNAYNADKSEVHKPGKRMVIIDGSNVAYAYSMSKNFCVKGIEICLDYFKKMGHEVRAVVPMNRTKRNHSTDGDRLNELHREGYIVFTPCKSLPGKNSTSYDDRFILQLAVEFDAAIVSNDNYRDLIQENPAFKKIIENRVIGYTFCKDVFILPKDPYGRHGPSLTNILFRS